ncbi:hypothetical protein [Methylophilus sp. UBA6697]|jgi:hypothetical protein|uniref:hypothetical protein n=1 Tax=Methylophilus sp. UBA6697 TaxID=1946902 RepID=UPI000ECB9355|nr:hypothetical protein [Methylophilus sp. UBA6697]HCU84104.1 hypothetical protein [Methylophilus sp.]
MRFIVMVLLAVPVVVLPYISYGQTSRQVDHDNAAPKPVCVTNLRVGAACESSTESHQSMVMVPMVMIRGQLLPVR